VEKPGFGYIHSAVGGFKADPRVKNLAFVVCSVFLVVWKVSQGSDVRVHSQAFYRMKLVGLIDYLGGGPGRKCLRLWRSAVLVWSTLPKSVRCLVDQELIFVAEKKKSVGREGERRVLVTKEECRRMKSVTTCW
jgi:hypothetical protein